MAMDRTDSESGSGDSVQTAAHGQTDRETVKGGGFWRWIHGCEGCDLGVDLTQSGGFCTAGASARGGSGGFRLCGGHGLRPTLQGGVLCQPSLIEALEVFGVLI